MTIDGIQSLRQLRMAEAQSILDALGMPPSQQNERSALTFLALANMKPDQPWSSAGRPLRGITPLMAFFREFYNRSYAPNTRETIRRQSVHQFRDAGLILVNPDNPQRPINSGLTVYQLSPETHALIQQYGLPAWEHALARFRISAEPLRERYAQLREQQRVPVTLPGGGLITLAAGGQNGLIREIIEQFASRFVPGGIVLYIGDADDKWVVSEQERLFEAGISPAWHGKMPDVVLEDRARGWLVLIEAVTSHGPISPQRQGDLAALFGGSKLGLVYVTAFLDRRTLKRHLADISWETEAWVADTPDHLIHFDGERFLGPYGDSS